MENRSPSTSNGSSDLRQELSRLQDREALLTHLLCLEREKRVKAEQLVEAEHQACLELGRRLGRERNLLAAARKSGDRKKQQSGGDGEVGTEMVDHDDGVSVAQELGTDENNRISKNVTAETVTSSSDGRLRSSPPVSSEGSDSGLAMMSPLESDFSSAVFSQLTSDLQDMLKVGALKDSSLEHADRLAAAREAVEANDARTLQTCILSVDMETLSQEGKPLLELASEYGRTGCLKVLLEGGCDPNCRVSNSCDDDAVNDRSKDGSSPLHIAAKYGHLGTLSLLLKHGADPHSQDGQGHTPLFLAAREGHVKCAQTLLEQGAKVDTLTKLSETALHAAVQGNSPSILRNLIVQMRITMETAEMGHVINHSDSDGRTPLHLSASLGHKECAEVLCAHVAVDTVKRDRWNRTPLAVAKLNCKEILLNKESREVVVYVESCGSSPVHTTHGGSSPVSHSDSRTAIGRISILHHHKLTDLELLVEETFKQYWNALKVFGNSQSVDVGGAKVGSGRRNTGPVGVELWDGCKSLQERITKAFTLSKSLLQREEAVHTSSGDNFKETYMRWSKEHLKFCRSGTATMDLNEDSILSYRIDLLSWKPGEIPASARLKTLFNVFSELERQHGRMSRGEEREEGEEGVMEVTVSLKGFREGRLDQLAFDSMIPVYKLKEYADMIEEHKALMIEGAQGSGKTYLALALANHFKYKHSAQGTQVIHVSLHPGFHRDDLFRLLHINGLLVPAPDEKEEELDEQRKMSTIQSRTYVLVLDDLSKVSVPEVLAELLTTITYRGEEHPVWISDVFGRDGSLLYPCGHYYLQPQCYFITTKTKSRDKSEPTCFDQFPHISLDYRSEPCSGVLSRQLTAKLIHCSLGDLPYNASFLPRLLLWTIDVWLLYNHLVQSLDLPELMCGMKNFIQCPLESKDPEVIMNWLSSLWNLQLAPAIESSLQSDPRLSLVSSPHHVTFNSSPHIKSSQAAEQHRYKALMQLLLACTRLVFLPTCPLQLEMKMTMIEQLSSRLEGVVNLNTGSPRREARWNTIERQNSGTTAASTGPGTPPLPSHVMSRGTPPTPGKSQERRGSLSKHSPSSNKAGNMFSYEDMIRNSPRNTPKVTRHKSTPTTPPLSRKMQPDKETEAVKQEKPATPIISPKKPPSGDSSSKVIEGVPLREKADGGRSKTLRKLRSKTVALFSKDGGYTTLPKLFRRGSRSSLVSFSEDDPKKSHANEHPDKNKPEVEELGALYDLLSSAAQTSRYEGQRSPPPPSPPPEESVDGGNKDDDLDDIFDMMTTINADRIDEQRTSIPAPTWQNAASAVESPDAKLKKKTKISKKVAKYFLPTGSPFMHRKLRVSRSAAASPTNISMPDLTAEEEGHDSSRGGHTYVSHSTSNTPRRGRSRLSSDTYVHSCIEYPNSRSDGHNGYKYGLNQNNKSVVEGQRVRSSSFSSHSHYRVDANRGSYPSSILAHNRAYLYDNSGVSSCATDPVGRKKPLVHSRSHDLDLTTHSPLAASSVPSVSHPPLPPTSPLATTAYSSGYHDGYSYTDSDGSPFVSHQHTQSTSTTNTASFCDEVADSSSMLHDNTMQASSGLSDGFYRGTPVSPPSPPRAQDKVHSMIPVHPKKRFQAKSVENLNSKEDDMGDLFRAASDGEVNQSSSPVPSPTKIEEENRPEVKKTDDQPPMAPNSIPKGTTSITMMHCNYHSIYPEENTDTQKGETEFSSPYGSRVRSVSAAVEPLSHLDNGYDSCYRRRRQSETFNTSPPAKQNGGQPSSFSSSSLDYQKRRHSTTTSDNRYHRSLSNRNSLDGSSCLSQSLSSPTAKVPRPSDMTTLLFSATLGFSELLQTGSRDRTRLSSQSHHDEIAAEM